MIIVSLWQEKRESGGLVIIIARSHNVLPPPLPDGLESTSNEIGRLAPVLCKWHMRTVMEDNYYI